MNQNHFLVVGDDKRQKYLAEELRQEYIEKALGNYQ